MNSYKKILADTIKILSFHHSLGLEKYPLTKGLKDFLALPIAGTPSPQPSTVQKRFQNLETTTQNKPVPQETTTLADIRAELGDCTRCSLHQGRTSILFGSGSKKAKLLIVGEWPNRFDDQAGELFAGEDGEMLDKMLTHVLNISRDEVYLASVIKCRVPEDTQPDLQQINSCKPFLFSQLAVIQPEIICTMGQLAAQTLLKSNKPLIRLRGHFHEVNGISLMPTFHPSYLIKNPEMKQAAFLDLQMIRKKLAL